MSGIIGAKIILSWFTFKIISFDQPFSNGLFVVGFFCISDILTNALFPLMGVFVAFYSHYCSIFTWIHASVHINFNVIYPKYYFSHTSYFLYF